MSRPISAHLNHHLWGGDVLKLSQWLARLENHFSCGVVAREFLMTGTYEPAAESLLWCGAVGVSEVEVERA